VIERHAVRAIHHFGHGFDLLVERHGKRVQKLELLSVPGDRAEHRVCNRNGTLAAVAEMRGDFRLDPSFSQNETILLRSLGLSLSKRLTATTGSRPNSRIFSMCFARFPSPPSFVYPPCMQRPWRLRRQPRRRIKIRDAALDMKEFLRAQVRSESGFRHNVIGQLRAMRVAMAVLVPWQYWQRAACTNAGVPSMVWTRLGLWRRAGAPAWRRRPGYRARKCVRPYTCTQPPFCEHVARSKKSGTGTTPPSLPTRRDVESVFPRYAILYAAQPHYNFPERASLRSITRRRTTRRWSIDSSLPCCRWLSTMAARRLFALSPNTCRR